MPKPAPKPKDIVGGHGMSNTKARDIHLALVELTGSEDYEGLNYDDIIEIAKQPDHPFHSEFEWRIKKAAYAHWCTQARKMVSSVRLQIVTFEGYTAKAREIINVRTSADHEKRQQEGFMSRGKMKRLKRTRKQYVDRALEELWQWTQRHGDIDELTKHRKAILRLPDVLRK